MGVTALAGTRWVGTSELWLDPLGDVAIRSDCVLVIASDGVDYQWANDGTPHHGRIRLTPGGGTFTDSFHSPSETAMTDVAAARALFDLAGVYPAGDGPPWGWRITLSHRPSWDGAPEALVLQMTNIAPWGEETRAARMIAARQ